MAAFRADPAAFADGIVASKGDLAEALSKIVARDPDTVLNSTNGGSGIAIVNASVSGREKDIARAIASAAKACVNAGMRDVAIKIQQAVGNQFDPSFVQQFAEYAGDFPTGSFAAAASGGAAGGGIGGTQQGGSYGAVN